MTRTQRTPSRLLRLFVVMIAAGALAACTVFGEQPPTQFFVLTSIAASSSPAAG